MLEGARRAVPESPFVYMSTNKVYSDAPNEIALTELETRWDYSDPAFAAAPRCGEVYNIGGGRGNSCSIMEAFALAESLSEKPMQYEHVEQTRAGDHICYISNLSKMRSHYPFWDISVSLPQLCEEIVRGWHARGVA